MPDKALPLIERLPDDTSGLDSDICGNDESNRENSQKIPKERLKSPFMMRVHWKRSSKHQPRLVGCYRLNLRALLEGGFIYEEEKTGKLRIKIQHDGGKFYLRRAREEPSILLS